MRALHKSAPECVFLSKQVNGWFQDGHLKTSRYTIKTEGMDALTVFDISRFFKAHLSDEKDLVMWITEKGPFSEAEEMMVFSAFIKDTTNKQDADLLLFDRNDKEVFAVIFAVCILFRWDFFLIAAEGNFFAQHSHDNGINIYQANDALWGALTDVLKGCKKGTGPKKGGEPSFVDFGA